MKWTTLTRGGRHGWAAVVLISALSGLQADEPLAVPAPPPPVPGLVTEVLPSLEPQSVPAPAPNNPGEAKPPADAKSCDTCGPVDWTKVPPVLPMPRLGNFLVWPSGPGYYSLCDKLTNQYREKAPAMPWGFISPTPMSFFSVDFRYLDKKDNKQHDYLDFLKRIHPTDDFLISFGGETRLRYMSDVDFQFTENDDQYLLFRQRLYGDFWFRDKARLFVEYIYAEAGDRDLNPIPIDINRSDFLNLFVELKLFDFMDKPVYARVGRQEMLLGSQRLISPLDWANTRRTFQGVRFYRPGDKWDFDAFWMQPVIPHRNHLDSIDDNVHFAGAWLTHRPKPGTFWDLYYLNLNDSKPVFEGSGGDKGTLNVSTIGTRYAGDYESRFLWDVELMLQLGEWSNQTLVAGATSVGAGYCLNDWECKPQFWLTYDYASGDSNPGQGDHRTTFNQLFPFGHYYLGALDLVGRRNIHDINAQVGIFPAKWIAAWAQVHRFWLAETRDSLYNAAGAPIRTDPTGQAGRDVGTELDLFLSLHLTTHSDVWVGWSKLYRGDFIERTGPAVSPELFYLQYGYRW